MKVEELRLLMKEVVRETMREELSSILTEAVQIASTPSNAAPASKPHFTEPDWVQELKTQQSSPSSKPLQESRGAKSPLDMLKATAQGMSMEDFRNFS